MNKFDFQKIIVFKKLKSLLLILMTVLISSSCSTDRLTTSSVSYQSVRPINYKPDIPDDAKIAVYYCFSTSGQIVVVITNMTDNIMTLDLTKSFLINSDHKSISYYDPTVRVESNTSTISNTSGGTVNAGAIASVLGVGGRLGRLASGINVGSATTEGTSTTNTTYFADQPQVSLGPKGEGILPKKFQIPQLGSSFLGYSPEINRQFSPANSYCKFSVCISYSLDGGETFEKIVTEFFTNSWIACPVKTHGKVNDALHALLCFKPDALNEPWWLLHFESNINRQNNLCNYGTILDYK